MGVQWSGMKKDEALRLVEEIQSICTKRGLWCTVEFERKPDLKMIKIEISIKIEK
jgi:hypothetical protein